jgi:tetratricopeptide (TPR) repeat protein
MCRHPADGSYDNGLTLLRSRASVLAASVTLLSLSLVLASLSGCGGAESRRASHIARGKEYLAGGRLEKARVEFANALQIKPADAEARYLSGYAAERLGDPRGAAALYQAAVDADPGLVQARVHLGRLYLLADLPQKALELIAPALRDEHPDPDLLTVRAAARARLKDDDGALADAQRSVQLAPTNEEAVLVLAELYRLSDQSPRAARLLETALQQIPQSMPLHQVAARLYIASGNAQLAEHHLAQVVQLHPGELAPRVELAHFYIRMKRVDAADQTLQAAMAASPHSDEAKLTYASFVAAYQPRSRAQQVLRQLIAQASDNLDLQLGLAAMQQSSGATAEALATYRSIVARDPAGPKGISARDRIAAVAASEGRLSDALPLLAEALRYNPRDNDALILRGNIELERGDAAAAIADLRAVLREKPTAIPVARSLARAHLANHESSLAEQCLRTALASAPQDVGLRIDLARLLRRTGRFDQSIALLLETIKEAPDASTPVVRAELIEAYLAKPDLPAARAAAEAVKQAHPDSASGWYLAGLVAEQQKRTEDARREYAHAQELEPDANDALTALARLDFKTGQHARAIALVRAAVERMPDSAARHNLLGELYLADKDYLQAMRVLTDAVRLAPNWWVPYGNLARAKLAANDSAGGLAAYQAGVESTEAPELVAGLAAVYEQQGKYEDAIRAYDALHERRPQLVLAANNLAMLLATYRHDRGSLDRARDLSASFASSQAAALLDTHGWVMLKRGEVAAALTELKKASASAPDSKVILYHLGIAQLKAGLDQDARSSLEAALQGEASFAGAEEARLVLAQLMQGHSG